MDQHEIIAGLREERERLTTYLRSLPAEAWERPSLCEGWSVRDVVSHLVGNCADVLEQNLDGVGSTAYNQRQIDERASSTPEQLLAEWDGKGPGCEAVYEAMPPELWSFEMGGIIGTIGAGVRRQLEDLWVHAQDIRLALGDEPTSGTGLAAALELIADELPAQFRRYAPHFGRLDLALEGAARTVALGGEGGPLRIAGDPAEFALIATGRRSLAGSAVTLEPVPEGAETILNIYGESFSERV